MEENSILVVDDEKNIRLTLSEALAALALPVQTAVNGEEALQKLERDEFGLMILDLKMPGIDGIEVLRRVKQKWPKVRIIVVTAHGTIESAVEAMKLGADDFIQKPFTPWEIREAVLHVLEREASGEEKPAEHGTLIELARLHISDGKFAKARAAAQKAIAADPAKPDAYNLLGALLEIAGDWLSAQKFYRMALDVEPTYEPAQANLERATSMQRFGKIHLGPDPGIPLARELEGSGAEYEE
jgi:DNA-binding response OmpR family regulator